MTGAQGLPTSHWVAGPLCVLSSHRCYYLHIKLWHFDGVSSNSSCDFNLHFLMTSELESFFHMFGVHWAILSLRMTYSNRFCSQFLNIRLVWTYLRFVWKVLLVISARAVSVLTLNPLAYHLYCKRMCLFLAMLGVLCLMGCFSSCADGELLSHCGVWASHVVDSHVEQEAEATRASVVVAPAL